MDHKQSHVCTTPSRLTSWWKTSTNTVWYAIKQWLRGNREGFAQLLSVGETEALVWSLLDYFRMKTEMRQELFTVSKSFWELMTTKYLYFGESFICFLSVLVHVIVSFNFLLSVFPFWLAFSFLEVLFSLSLLPLLSVFLSSLAAALPCTEKLLGDSHLHISFDPLDIFLFCFLHKGKCANFFGWLTFFKLKLLQPLETCPGADTVQP